MAKIDPKLFQDVEVKPPRKPRKSPTQREIDERKSRIEGNARYLVEMALTNGTQGQTSMIATLPPLEAAFAAVRVFAARLGINDGVTALAFAANLLDDAARNATVRAQERADIADALDTAINDRETYLGSGWPATDAEGDEDYVPNLEAQLERWRLLYDTFATVEGEEVSNA